MPDVNVISHQEPARGTKLVCAFCGSEFIEPRPSHVAKRECCSRKCGNTLRSKRSAIQRSEAQRNSSTEKRAYRKFHGVHEHRVVMERKLGRALLRHEIVHHVNGDCLDNRPENLEVMTRAEHARIHFSGKPGKKKLSDDDVRAILWRLALGVGKKEICEAFDVCNQTLRAALRRGVQI